LEGTSGEIGSDASNGDSSVEGAGSEGSDSSAIEVESGLSALRCSNVANLLEWALDALAVGDVERARAALVIAVEIVASSSGPTRD
jgi:hypothetical protein